MKFRLFLIVSCFWVAFGGASTALAHDEGVHAPTTLPACRSRLLTCEMPSDLAAQANLPMEMRHCIDGIGNAADCADVVPFTYLAFNSSNSVPSNQDAKDTVTAAQRDPLFATNCSDGMAGEFPCSQIDLQAFLPLSMFGEAGAGNDSWGWTDPQTGAEYALMGLNIGTAFVDISNAEAPIFVGTLPTHTRSSSWRDIKVYADHAYIVADLSGDHGLQVFDLTQLRAVTEMPATFTETAHYNQFGDAHNIAINEKSGFAYAVGSDTCSGGLHMIDIRDPIQPQFAGCYANDGYTHDAQCVIYRGPDLVYNDHEICFNSNEDTVTIVDVSDKAVPILVARVGAAGNHYVHQGWLTEDQRYFLQDDELDELFEQHNTRTYLWDMVDLDNPVLVGTYTGPLESTDHNLYVLGSHVFEANYTSGLRVLNLSGLANGELNEVAYFDTEPDNNNARTRSAWNVYPFFKSGSVIVSTITEGLFVLKPHLAPEFTLNADDNLISVCAEGTEDAQTLQTALTLEYLNGYTEPPPTLSIVDASAAISSALSLQPKSSSPLAINQTHYALSAQFPVTVTGGFPLRVVADTETTQKEVAVTFFVANAVPDVVSTQSGTVVLPESKGLFNWHAAKQGLIYEFELASDSAFTQLLDMIETPTVTLTVPTPLVPQTDYYWRVRARNSCGVGPYSAVQKLTPSGTRIFLPIMKQQ